MPRGWYGSPATWHEAARRAGALLAAGEGTAASSARKMAYAMRWPIPAGAVVAFRDTDIYGDRTIPASGRYLGAADGRPAEVIVQRGDLNCVSVARRCDVRVVG